MNIVILSRGPQLYSTQSLIKACRKRNHNVRIIDHVYCDLSMVNGQMKIFYDDKAILNVDAIIPRIGASVTKYGDSVINHFEKIGIYTTLSSQALLNSRNKLKCLQLLSAGGVDIVDTFFPNQYSSLRNIERQLGKYPIILKLVEGTHGMGVLKANNRRDLESLMETFGKLKKSFLLQRFIAESRGEDVRIIVVDGRVVATMKRMAKAGDFRSNLHRGGRAIHIVPTKAEIDTALSAAEVLGLDVAGVDILQTDDGPQVLEVNASPGLEGIETTTKVDISGKIINMIERKVLSKSSGAISMANF